MELRPSDSRFHFGQHILCAGTAATIGRLAVHPFSVLKISAEVGASGAKMGPSRTLQFFNRSEGLISMVGRGAAISGIRAFAHYGILFGAYDRFSRLLIPKSKSPGELVTIPQIGGAYLSGALAGTLATIVTHPMDLVKVRLIAQPMGRANQYYSGVAAAFSQILNKEGIYRGVYKGLASSIIGGASFAGDLFMFLYIFENLPWRKRGIRFLGPLDDLIYTMMAFGGAAFANHPFDVIRRKVMAQSAVLPKGGNVDIKFNHMVNLVIQMWKSNGLWSFYQGALPNMMKVGPQIITFALVYNGMKSGWLAVGGSAKLAA